MTSLDRFNGIWNDRILDIKISDFPKNSKDIMHFATLPNLSPDTMADPTASLRLSSKRVSPGLFFLF